MNEYSFYSRWDRVILHLFGWALFNDPPSSVPVKWHHDRLHVTLWKTRHSTNPKGWAFWFTDDASYPHGHSCPETGLIKALVFIRKYQLEQDDYLASLNPAFRIPEKDLPNRFKEYVDYLAQTPDDQDETQ